MSKPSVEYRFAYGGPIWIHQLIQKFIKSGTWWKKTMEFSANQAFSDGFQHSELSVVACDTQVIPIIYKPKH